MGMNSKDLTWGQLCVGLAQRLGVQWGQGGVECGTPVLDPPSLS